MDNIYTIFDTYKDINNATLFLHTLDIIVGILFISYFSFNDVSLPILKIFKSNVLKACFSIFILICLYYRPAIGLLISLIFISILCDTSVTEKFVLDDQIKDDDIDQVNDTDDDKELIDNNYTQEDQMDDDDIENQKKLDMEHNQFVKSSKDKMSLFNEIVPKD